jgi:hypothetical protein
MQGPATTLPAKGIARSCFVLDSATSVALAMPTANIFTNSGDGITPLLLILLPFRFALFCHCLAV